VLVQMRVGEVQARLGQGRRWIDGTRRDPSGVGFLLGVVLVRVRRLQGPAQALRHHGVRRLRNDSGPRRARHHAPREAAPVPRPRAALRALDLVDEVLPGIHYSGGWICGFGWRPWLEDGGRG